MEMTPSNPSRYSRQEAFGPIGRGGQERLGSASVALVGCGALGSHIAEMLVRAGVGRLRLVDRDFIELSNLQRQALFDEADVAANLPKAEAAARKLRAINSEVHIEPLVGDVNPDSVGQVLEGMDLLLDGTDNLLTRFLLNDAALEASIPWVYGACLGSRGMGMVVRPGGRPCLACVMDPPSEPGSLETCQTAGIIAPAAATVAAWQVTQALKILTGHPDEAERGFWTFDLWAGQFRTLDLADLQEGCPVCRERDFEYLRGKGALTSVSLCGQGTVQIRPRQPDGRVDLAELARRLSTAGPVQANEFLVRLTLPQRELELTVFRDGRAIVKGTSSKDLALATYAQYVSH